ncbi:MAG: hypothetical protein QOD24_4491 [Solirubrobacteraceae bacterium]|jgi:Ca2+-binding RTX toxin-like protein|nr:hypothetical protein [Solirubrobacteraceae bacterium]
MLTGRLQGFSGLSGANYSQTQPTGCSRRLVCAALSASPPGRVCGPRMAPVGVRCRVWLGRRRWLLTAPVITDEANVLSVTGFERVIANLAGGTNKVLFDEGFSGSDVGLLRVDVGPPNNDPNRDSGQFNTATFFDTTEGADRIRIIGTPAAGATVTGLGPAVVITRAQELSVFGKGGDDVINAGLMAAGKVSSRLIMSGGAGNDTLIGHPGDDGISGGDGDDRIEGRGGNDSLNGDAGNNVIIP